MNLNELYTIADRNEIDVFHYPLQPLNSMATRKYIAIDADQITSTVHEKELLAHELGHCETGAFYTGTSPLELRSQKEYKADKWAITKLIPFDELKYAMENSIDTIKELADYFDVSERFVIKALAFYSKIS